MSGRAQTPEPAAEKPPRLRAIARFVLTDGLLMLLALVITVVLFVLTRDEVTQRFTVPLRVQQDPDRVLLTDVPGDIAVDVRGPWARVNRVDAADFGAAVLDLREAEPGPLIIDRASIVMPQGVVLAGIDYDEVDLRFEPVVEKEVRVVPTVRGTPARDYQLVAIGAQPATVRIRGGQSRVFGLAQLSTEVYDLREVSADVEVSLAIAQPPEGVTIVGDPVYVRVVADIAPRTERMARRVVVERSAIMLDRGGLPTQVEIELSGPAPEFRVLEAAGLDAVLEAVVRADPEAPDRAFIEVGWAEGVPAGVREALSIDPSRVAVDLLPLPPRPDEPTGAPTR